MRDRPRLVPEGQYSGFLELLQTIPSTYTSIPYYLIRESSRAWHATAPSDSDACGRRDAHIAAATRHNRSCTPNESVATLEPAVRTRVIRR